MTDTQAATPQAEFTDIPFVLLTQDNCAPCERLKSMLSGPLRGAFDAQIHRVHRQEREDEFVALAGRHGVRSTPALIRLRDGASVGGEASIGAVRTLLEG